VGDFFRLATFNLRHAASPGHFARIGRAAKACVNLRADVLALQEVDAAAVRSFFVNQPAWIAAAVGAEWCFLPNWTHRALGRFGNALLVRGRLLDPVVVELPGSGAARARKALLAEVVLAGGTRLTVAATHLDERRRKIGAAQASKRDAMSVHQRAFVLDLALFPTIFQGSRHLAGNMRDLAQRFDIGSQRGLGGTEMRQEGREGARTDAGDKPEGQQGTVFE